MATSSKGSGRRDNPLAKPKKQRKARPSSLDKQATVFAAEQNLKPWELPSGKAKQPSHAKASPAPTNARYKAAVAAPVNAPVKVGKKKVPARDYLAETMTPKRRSQYERISAPPAPKPDTSFVHALLSTPVSVAHHLGVGGEAVGKKLFGGPIVGQGPAYGLVPTRHDLAATNKQLVGPALYNALTKGQTSHLAAAGLEAAALLPPFKGLRALKLLRGAKVAEEAAPLERKSTDQVMREIGAHDLESGEQFRPDLYERHPKSGFMVRNSKPRTVVINDYGKPPRIMDTVPAPHRMGNEVPVKGSVRPPKYLYRAVSEEEYQQALKNGYFKSDGRMNLGASEGTVAALRDPTWYLPGKLASSPHGERLGRVVRIKYQDGDGWLLDRDGYVKTQARIPIERVDRAPQFKVVKGHIPSSITGNPIEHISTEPTGQGMSQAQVVAESAVPGAKTPAQELVAGLPQASRLVRDEKALRARELGMRTREAQRRMEAGGFTEEARKHASEALSGAMPTLRWGKFTEMTPETLDDMVHHIETHPAFQGNNSAAFFKRKNTRDALARIMTGYHPRDFEIKLLREAFGETTTQDLIESVGFWKKNGNRVLDVIGIPRSLLSSFDLSAPLRQNLVFATSHPILWGKNFGPMIKAFGSTEVQNQIVRKIVSDPDYDLMERADLRFTDLGHDILKREEGFQSNYAETLTGGKFSPVRASNRAYVTFNNKSRYDLFKFLLEKINNLHPELDWQSREGDKMLKEMGRLVNNATGRGKFPIRALDRSMPILNALLFSPRLLASRLDVLSYPATVWTMNSVTRREALKQLGALTGAVTGVVGLAALGGAKITRDPRNADFGKVRVGNTRFDVAGGFLQPVRLAAQLGTGKVISSTTGKTLSLTSGKFGTKNRLGIFFRFMESKEAPPVGFIVNWSRGTDFAGKPFSVQSEAYNRLVPLLVQDAKQAYDSGDSDTGSVALAMAIYGIGMWGIGTQTYGTPKPKSDPLIGNPLGGSNSGGGGNPLSSSGSSGSSNPLSK